MSDSTLVVVSDSKTKETALEYAEIRKDVQDARRKTEESYWEFSVLLHDVYAESYYVAWGYKSWNEYIELELDMQRRKAQYLVSIQDWFGRMKPNIQKWVRELGWTKAKELVGIVDNDNAAEWKSKIGDKSYREMMEVIRGVRELEASGDGAAPATPTGETSIKKSFVLFPDQASNVDLALGAAKQLARSEKDGHALDMICVDFLSTNNGIGTVQAYLAKVEQAVGISLIAYDKGADAIVYGDKTLDSIVED